jgi:hypothetical protein
MKNKRLTSTLQRKRQSVRRYQKVATRRQEFFLQTLDEEKSED